MELLNDGNRKEYMEFIQSSEKGSFMQAPMWAEVKDNWKNEVIIERDGSGKISGSLSVLIRPVPLFHNTMMYAPRGPVCDIHDKDTITKLVNDAKELAKQYKSYVLKIDPDVKSDDQEFADIMSGLGFRSKNKSKNFEGIQPRFVFRLDVQDKTEDEVMAVFHSKTRYNIRLAVKKGVTVQIGGRKDLKRFHEIMVETGLRDEFVTRNLEYFEKMYDVMAPENLRLYCAYYEGKMIAGTIAIYFGDKVWYLYGASSNEYRNVMPNYLLQWEMIKWSIEKGCRIYDFRGVSGDIDESNPLYGLYRFKKGFNGEFTEFIGELDLVFNGFVYFAAEKGEKTFRELRRRLYLLKKGK